MRFLSSAGAGLSRLLCASCDTEIKHNDAVRYDADEQLIVLHAGCWDYAHERATKAAALARAVAYAEAAKFVEHIPKDEAITALKTRADQAWREALRTEDVVESGADVMDALFRGLSVGKAS